MISFFCEFIAGHGMPAAVRLAWVTGLVILASGCTTIQSPEGTVTTVHRDGSVDVRGSSRPEPSKPPTAPAENVNDEARTRALAETIAKQEQQMKANASLLSEHMDKRRRVAADVQALEARVEQGRAAFQKFAGENGELQRLNISMTSKITELTGVRDRLTHDTEGLQHHFDALRAEAAKLDATWCTRG